jgi:hypothetical protein
MLKLIQCSLLALAFALPAFAQSPTCDILWNSPLRVSFDSVVTISPQIAVAGDSVHLVWFGFDTLGTERFDGVQYARSTDGGLTFSPQLTLSSFDTAQYPGYVGAIGPNVFVAYGGTQDTASGAYLRQSTDAGVSWLPARYLRSRAIPRFVLCDSTTTYILFQDGVNQRYGILRSLDTGRTWQTTSTNAPELTSLVSAGGRLHGVGTLGANLKDVYYYQSPTGGFSWGFPEALSAEDFTTSNAPRIASNGRNELYCVWTEEAYVLFRRSRNLGDNWFATERLSETPGAIFADIAAGAEFVTAVWDNDFAGVRDIHVRPSNDYGREFCPVDSAGGGGTTAEPTVRIDRHTAHTAWTENVAGSLAVFYRSGTLTDNPDLAERPPREYALKQNYPNPFNAATHIRFDLPAPGHVKLTVYNVLGQKIQTLIDADLPAGRPEVLFDAGRHASGLYLYRLQTPAFTEIRTMLLVR